MKIYRLICTFWFCSALFFGARLVAQNTPTAPYQTSPVEISRVVDTILGKVYRVHTVQKGHTLYSICRVYQTSADSILKDSPENQVQVDELIYIPFRPQENETAQDLTRFTGKRPWAVVFLQKDESTESLLFAEKADKKRLSPANRRAQVEPDSAQAPGESINTAESNGTITKKAEENQPPRKRRERKGERNGEEEEIDTEVLADTLLVEVTDSIFITPHPNAKESKDQLRISMLLPLYSSTPQDKKAYIYLPFFEGASIAWQEFSDPFFFNPPVPDTVIVRDSTLFTDSVVVYKKLQPAPLPPPDTGKADIHLKVYDLTQSADALEEIVNDAYFKESDAVIAMAFVDQFQWLDSLSKEWEMPIIHPISERDMMSIGNPYFMQLAASYSTQIHHIADFVGKHHPHAHILIISDSTETEVRKAEILQSLLTDSVNAVRDVQKLYFNPETAELLDELGKSERKTVIIPFYRNEITAVRTVLPLRQTKGNVTIIAPNVWLDYATIDLDYYIQNNLTVYHTFCNAVQNTDFKEFSKNYHLLYHGLPNLLAYQGYRTLLWLVGMLNAHNADFMRHMEEMPETDDVEIQEFYLFRERAAGGFENTNVHFVKITDFGLAHIR